MKKILFLVFQLFAISAFAQYLPLQGRLVQNNAPLANGNYNFSFALFAPNSNTPLWAELQTVPVNGGLYSTVLGRVTRLPRNPFGNSDSLRLTVTLNGTLLDHITIFPALERDLAFRDSIDWVKVTNKPSLDTQKLVVVGRNLTITNGNTIQLPLNATGQFDSTLQVGQSGSRTETGVNQNVSTGTITLRSIWQSFPFEEQVQLVQVQVRCANFNSTSFRLKLYRGQGNNSQSVTQNLHKMEHCQL
jgi:hypothetical protein